MLYFTQKASGQSPSTAGGAVVGGVVDVASVVVVAPASVVAVGSVPPQAAATSANTAMSDTHRAMRLADKGFFI
jgi:hypothetical protein